MRRHPPRHIILLKTGDVVGCRKRENPTIGRARERIHVASRCRNDRSRTASAGVYDKLEERILARDQVGASQVYLRSARPAARRRDAARDGAHPRAVHPRAVPPAQRQRRHISSTTTTACLSARARSNCRRSSSETPPVLPMAQTIWYIPTGLDIWNQKIGKAPGHYSSRLQDAVLRAAERAGRPLARPGPLSEMRRSRSGSTTG